MSIKLLLKATEKIEYATTLQNGILYMNMPYYYKCQCYLDYLNNESKFHSFADFIEKSSNIISDVFESNAGYNNAICMHEDLFIYSTTAIYNQNVFIHNSNTYVKISKQLIDSFKKANYNYLTFINYDKFINELDKCSNKLCGKNLVIYKDLSDNDTTNFLRYQIKPINLFYKKPVFKYQNEFRVVTNISGGQYKIHIDYTENKLNILDYKTDTIVKNFPHYDFKIAPIKDFCEIIELDELQENLDFYYYAINEKVIK